MINLEPQAREIAGVCKPASPIGGLLLERYVAAIDFTRSSSDELLLLRSVCRLVEDTPFDAISVEALERAGAVPQPTRKASRRRAFAARRLRRLLQTTGELPSEKVLALEKKIADLIADAPPAGRGTLNRWNDNRASRLGAFERFHEIRHLARLELVIAEIGDKSDEVLIQLWIDRTVRQIVDCGCHQVGRALNPDHCIECGATSDTCKTTASPGQRKQRRLKSVVRRYLTFRRLPTPTASFS